MRDKPDRIYGPPGSEILYASVAEVYERLYDGRADLEQGARLEIEEWTVIDNREHLFETEEAIYEILHWPMDGGEVTEEWSESALSAAKDPDVVEAFDTALNLLASKIAYWMADKKVNSHWVELVDGEVMVNGESLYQKTKEADQ